MHVYPRGWAHVLLIGAMAACGRPPPERSSVGLLEHTPVAEKRWGGLLVELGVPSVHPYLGEGWSYGETAPDGNAFRWAVGREASFRLASKESGRRLAWLECEPFRFPSAPPQSVDISVNGRPLPRLTLREGRHRYPLEIPIVQGLNEIRFRFAYAGAPRGREPSRGDRRRLAVAFYRLDVPPRDAPLVGGRPGPFALVHPPEGPPGVYLPEGASLSYHLLVPRWARLDVQVGTERPEALLAPAGARLDVVVATREGRHVEASARAEKARGSVVHLELSLEKLAGQRARISFSSGAAPLFVAPRLSASEPAESGTTRHSFSLPGGRNLVVIVLDGASALRMGPYGYGKRATPGIDGLARQSVVFDKAITQAVYTIASIGAVLTGQYPELHQSVSFADRLASAAVTLPGLLSQAGVLTAGFSGNAVVSPAFGLDRGYDEFYDVRKLAGYTGHGDSVVRSFVSWLEKNRERRFFAYIHFREPHFPYNPPPPFDRPSLPHGPFPEGIDDWRVVEALNRSAGRGQAVPEELIERIRTLYDGNMAYVDSLVGEILKRLRELGLVDRTIVVLTADHGEALFEHRYVGHNTQLYEESIRVPLMVRAPGLVARRVDQVVELIDLAPTVLELMGVSDATGTLQGRSLVPLLFGERLPSRPAFTRTLWNKPRYSLRGPHYKFIWDSRTDAMELYDLEDDPRERSNLVEAEPFLTAFFRQRLHQWLRRQERLRVGRPAAEPARVPEELRRDLEMLGYLSTVEKGKKK